MVKKKGVGDWLLNAILCLFFIAIVTIAVLIGLQHDTIMGLESQVELNTTTISEIPEQEAHEIGYGKNYLQGFEMVGWNSYPIYGKSTVTYEDAINAILDHLGLEFEHIPEESASHRLVPVREGEPK